MFNLHNSTALANIFFSFVTSLNVLFEDVATESTESLRFQAPHFCLKENHADIRLVHTHISFRSVELLVVNAMFTRDST